MYEEVTVGERFDETTVAEASHKSCDKRPCDANAMGKVLVGHRRIEYYRITLAVLRCCH